MSTSAAPGQVGAGRLPAPARPIALPRGVLISDVWAGFGDAVAPLSNPAGQPLARTVKLILDPLVLRPTQHPRLASGSIRLEDIAELRARLTEAEPVLIATAAWFVLVKKARRSVGITEGNPQDLYFQRCFELARGFGSPTLLSGAEAQHLARETVLDVRDAGAGMTVQELRRYVTDPQRSSELSRLLAAAWQAPHTAGVNEEPTVAAAIAAKLDTILRLCATDAEADALDAFDDLVATAAGTREAAELAVRGIARGYGLTTHPVVIPPPLGERASKNALPRPFDRSILERLFAGFTSAFQRERLDDIPSLVSREITRSAGAWQLGSEASRVVMAVGREASTGLDAPGSAGVPTDARARLRSRWEREAYVHRVLRLPATDAVSIPSALRDEIAHVRAMYLRRLWVRVHGRELRHEEIAAEDLWDLLDGVLRSVIMDQRDRLKAALERQEDRE